MKRLPFLLAAIWLALLLTSCGGGSSSSSPSSSASASGGSTTVAVTVGSDGTTAYITTRPDTLLARATTFLDRVFSTAVATAAIPTQIMNIGFTISASDMQTMTRNVLVAGRPTVTETFTVPNGSNRSILVELKDAGGVTQYRHSALMTLDGREVSVPMTMQTLAAPSFDGVTSASATSSTTVDLAWNPASDLHTAASAIIYDIFVASTSGGENYATPSFTTSAGATAYTVTGLTPSTTYYFVVRARNEQGYIDTNTIEKSAKTNAADTVAASDSVAPTFAGVASATAVQSTAGRVDLSWSAAADNLTSPSGIVYLVYKSTTAGQYTDPPSTTAAGATSYSVTGLGVGTYYFKVKARDAAGNVDTNAVEKSATVGSISITSGNNQVSDLNIPFTLPLKVTVASGPTPQSNVPVTFWVPSSGAGGTFADGSQTGTTTVTVTTVSGVATAPAFTANATTGPYNIIASTGSLSTTFTLTNVALGPFDMTNITSGAWDSAAPGATLIPVEVTVRDVNGAPLPGIPVTFSIGIGDTGTTAVFPGGATSVASVTNAQGIAAAPAQTGNTIHGEFAITITAAGRTTEAGRQVW